MQALKTVSRLFCYLYINDDTKNIWKFIENNTTEDDFTEELAQEVRKANEKMEFLANDKEVLRLYHLREMAQIDYNSGMKKAREDGLIEVARDILFNGKYSPVTAW